MTEGEANNERSDGAPGRLSGIVLAAGEAPLFAAGELATISTRSPVGHYRVPSYLRGKSVLIEAVIRPPGLNNEEEGFGRNAGVKGHYYRVAIAMKDVWPDYSGPEGDGLRIEVFESWLELSAS